MATIASLALSLDVVSAVPLYEQLRQQLLQAVEQDRLQAGDRLPSSRSLALSLGVSRSVVMQTYDQLICEGVLLSQPKRGVYIATTKWIQPQRRTAMIVKPPREILAFNSGVDVSQFPSKAWASSMRRAWLNPEPELLTGGFIGGYPPLQQAIVEYLYALRGLECQPEQIILVSGNRDALALLQHALRHEVEQWLLESPAYPPIREAFPETQTAHLTVQENDFFPPLKKLRWGAVLTPSRQYPLGFSYSSLAREAWLEALELQHGYIIEDDYDNEFLYQGKGTLPLAQAALRRGAARDRVFYIGSFSKVMFRGLRLGFIVVPLSQVTRLQSSQQALGQSAALPTQPALADFMNSGAFYRHLNRMRRHYRHKRDVLLRLLECHLARWFEWEKPKGGMHIIAYVKAAYALDHWCSGLDQLCREQDLQLSWLDSHYVEKANTPKGLVLGFTGVSEAQLTKMIMLLAHCCSCITENS